jgi:plastocyanin
LYEVNSQPEIPSMNMISEGRRAFVGVAFVALIISCLTMSLAQDVKKQGEVRGKITVTRSEADVGKPPIMDRYSTHRTSPASPGGSTEMAPIAKLSEKAVIYLESDAPKAQSYVPPSAHPILDQKDLTFHPQVLPILIGTTVDFPNRDNLFHNVFSYSSPKEFDLGRYPTGDSRSVRFDKAGIVRVYCDIHSHMNATILVLENPYFAIPDDGGTFIIRSVPNGTYMARLWYGRDLAGSQSVTIKNGETINLNFTY